MKVCLGVRGRQRKKQRARRNDSGVLLPSSDPHAEVYSVRTVRGGLLGLPMVFGQAPEHVRIGFETCVSQTERHLVEWIVVDNASNALLQCLLKSFPNLKGITTDTVHLAMKYETATGRYRTPGSSFLRRALGKFHVPWTCAGPSPFALPVFSGVIRPLSRIELEYRRHLKASSLPSQDVDKACRIVDDKGTWECFADWCMVLAAISTLYPVDMNKRTKKQQRPLRSILMAAASVERFGWYMNNSVLRRGMSPRHVALLGSGTCGNEALHMELRSAMRQLYDVHLPTLQTKLKLFVLAKQVAFDSASRLPLLRQMRQGEILARVLGRQLIDQDAWAAYCASNTIDDSVQKSVGNVALKRNELRRMLRVSRMSMRNARRRLKRTVFTSRKRRHLTGGGKEWSSFARALAK